MAGILKTPSVILTEADSRQEPHCVLRYSTVQIEWFNSILCEGQGYNCLSSRPKYNKVHPQLYESPQWTESFHNVGIITARA